MNLNFGDMFKNLAGIKGQMETLKNRMAGMKITGEAGAGMVSVVVSGEGVLTDVKIDPSLLDAKNREMVEELIISATNEALRKAKEAMAHEIRSITGINIPGMENFFGG